MKKIPAFVISLLSLFAVHGIANGAPIEIETARSVALNWARSADFVNGEILGATVKDAHAVTDAYGDTRFYVVTFEPSGYVVIASDDRLYPIIAFSTGDDLEENIDNPFYALLCEDVDTKMSSLESYEVTIEKAGGSPGVSGTIREISDSIDEARNDWEVLLTGETVQMIKTGSSPNSDIEKTGASRPSSVCVSPLVQSTWGQTTAGGVYGRGYLYNYYTPHPTGTSTDWPCGCVATALAQVMRYHQYPTASLPSKQFATEKNGSYYPLTTMSGTLDWRNMPLKPTQSITTTQRNAIAKLTYNAGVAVEMDYGVSGSGATTYKCADALTGYFGYKSASYTFNNSINEAILANLEYSKPVILALRNSKSGHCIIADGYGYSYSNKQPYVHLNLGWNGNSDEWYLLPNVKDYNTLSTIVFNIFPTESGYLICGTAKNASGTALANATVLAVNSSGKTVATATTNKRGLYVLLVPTSGTFTIKGSSGTKLEGETTTTISSYYNSCCNKWGVDLTLVERASTHKITFNGNGATSGTMSPQIVKDEVFVYLNMCTFVRDGYNFLGWSDKKSASTADYTDGDYIAFMSDITLYAVWEKIPVTAETFTVTFHPNGGKGASYTQEFTELEADYLTSCRFSRDDYTFLGWAQESGSDEILYYDGDYIAITNNLDLYAVWQYTIQTRVVWNISSDGTLTGVEPHGETALEIPASVKTIGQNAFSSATDVKEVTMPSSVVKIGADGFAGCQALEKINIPSSVTEIGRWAFSGCTALKSINIPDSVTRLHECVFYGCSSLKEVGLGSGLTIIPDATFTGCIELEELHIPSSIREIYPMAFRDCTNLRLLVFDGDAPDTYDDILEDTPGDCIVRVKATAYGWPEGEGALWPVQGPAGRLVDKPIGYTVSFDWNGWSEGIPIADMVVRVGESMVVPGAEYTVNSVREGYDFAGWKYDGGTLRPGELFVPAQDTTLRAYWVAKTVTVKFDANGGAPGKQTASLHYDDAWPYVIEPTKKGVTFTGWYTSKTGGREIDLDLPCDFSSDVTLYAHWAKSYAVKISNGFTYDENGDETSHTAALEGEYVDITAEDRSDDDYVFSHWSYTPAKADLGEDFNARLESCSFVMPSADVAFTANYIRNPAYVQIFLEQEDETNNISEDEVTGVEWSSDGKVWSPVDGESYPVKAGKSITVQLRSVNPKWIVPARATGVFDEEDGQWTVTAVATRVNVVSVEANEDEGPGTVSMSPANGQLAPGKTVTITAKPGKGAVFAYWESSDGDRVYQATAKVAPNCDTLYTAVFRMKEDLDDPDFDAGSYVESECAMVGVKYSAAFSVQDAALPAKYTAAGLPAGLKIDAASGVVSGVPTKPGTYDITVSATGGASGKAKSTTTCEITIAPLPAWGVGSFSGCTEQSDDDFGTTHYGLVTLSTTAAGKISGKIAIAGKNWTFSDTAFAYGDAEVLQIAATAKSGKDTRDIHIDITASTVNPLGKNGIAFAQGLGEFEYNPLFVARSPWKDKGVPASDLAGSYVLSLAPGTYTEGEVSEVFGAGYASLSVSAKGAVKATGKLGDGTSFSASSDLLWSDDTGWFFILYSSPSAYKGGEIFVPLAFMEDENDGSLTLGELGAEIDEGYSVSAHWINLNPAATSVYGEGWNRFFDITAAKWNKNATLNDLALGEVVFSADLPTLAYLFKDTGYDENDRRVTESWLSGETAQNTLWQDGSVVLANADGTKFTTVKATSPKKDEGDWVYEGENDGALTVSFNRATGVFKGSFTFYFDYLSAYDNIKDTGTMVHTSKKVSFEGVIVPESNAFRGFYVWDNIAEYEDEKTEKIKTYKFKESLGVVFKKEEE